jgi:hypothetical protein
MSGAARRTLSGDRAATCRQAVRARRPGAFQHVEQVSFDGRKSFSGKARKKKAPTTGGP